MLKITPITWSTLDQQQRQEILSRPKVSSADANDCQQIIDQVRRDGDQALFELTQRFDNVNLAALRVPTELIDTADQRVTAKQLDALIAAYRNIEHFHQAQNTESLITAPADGVSCELHYRPIDAVGLYVPGGTAPLPSTVLMLGVPSKIAGCKQRVLCTPPQSNGAVNDLVLAAAKLCGIEQVYSVGGAHAIAAMAYGTNTIAKVNKIFGPGNPWVTRAKQLVAQDADGAGCDLPAGPSEVLVIADEHANADYVAADLLSQAEHGADSQVLLVTTDERLATAVQQSLATQLQRLPRAELALQSLQHSRIVVVDSLERAIDISNQYAPEHLILNVRNARDYLNSVSSAGSVFLGQWSPESVGDYCSGTNHVLPTHGFAQHHSGVGVRDFQKRITVQELNFKGLQNIGWIAETLAKAEGLDAHALAVQIRLANANASTKPDLLADKSNALSTPTKLPL